MTAFPVAAQGRWAQMTYTSFDDGVHAGGWQVKQTSGSLTEEEQNRLRSQVVTSLELVDKLPSFPTPEEIAALPRRLVYVPDSTGEGRYWHTVFAGPDATGRPGNVFVHAVLDRRPGNDVSFRPIELWRSTDWLCPYGAEPVRDAVLGPAERPRNGDVVTANSVVDFILDPSEWRVGVLAALLDAVSAALQGGPRIVLGVDSPDSAAAWIGAVSQLTSPALARRISYTTFERAAGLESSWARGLLVAAIPTVDLGDVNQNPDSGHSVVVIDSSEAVSLGVLDEQAHTTAAGSRIHVTAWSVLAEEALLDADTAAAVLRELEVVGASVTTLDASPEWPLAAAMSALPEHFTDVASTLRSALLRGAPADLPRFTALADRVAGEVRHEIGGSAASAWKAISTGVRTPTYDMAVHSYLRLAISDPAWLAQSPHAPVPSTGHSADDGLGREFDRIIAERLTALDQGPVDAASVAGAVRVLDFGLRAGLMTPERPLSWTADVDRLVAEYLAPSLIGANGAELIRSLPVISPGPTRANIVRAVDTALRDRQASVSDIPELPGAVLGWLFGADIPTFDIERLTQEKSDSPDGGWPRPSAAAYILWLARTHGHDASLPPFVRSCAMWFALDAEDARLANAAHNVAALTRFEIDAESANCLLRDFGPQVPPAIVLAALERTPWPRVRSLAENVARLTPNLGRWTSPSSFVAQTVARVQLRAYGTGRRDAAWAAALRSDLETVFTSGLVSDGPAAQSWRRLLVAAVLTQYLTGIQARFDDTEKWQPPKGLYGTAFTRPLEEPTYLKGAAVDELQGRSDWSGGNADASGLSQTWQPPQRSASPRPAPHRSPHPQTNSLDDLRLQGLVGHVFAEKLSQMPGSAVLELVLPSLRAKAFDHEAILAIGLVGTAESGLTSRSKFRAVSDLLQLPVRDYDSVGEALMVELLRSGRTEIDPRRMDSLIDRIGAAQYGADVWPRRDSERTELARFSRKYFKQLQSKSEAGPAGERSRGGLRRNH